MDLKFELTIDTDNSTFTITSVDTGETQTVDLPKKKKASTKKTTKPVDDGDPTPKITLDDNKYSLNSAAADLLLNEGDDNRLEIKYMKNGKTTVPVIMNSNSGNKVTKSLTVACRGKAHAELLEYGTVFTLTTYPGKAGVYILNGDSATQPLEGDENINIPEEDDNVEIADNTPVVASDDDLDLDGLLSEDDKEEVNAEDFDL